MTISEWTGIGMLVLAALGFLWGVFTWLIDLLLEQSKETIAELRDDRDELREANQALRDENRDLREQLQERWEES